VFTARYERMPEDNVSLYSLNWRKLRSQLENINLDVQEIPKVMLNTM
jgi:hypothetical protein